MWNLLAGRGIPEDLLHRVSDPFPAHFQEILRNAATVTAIIFDKSVLEKPFAPVRIDSKPTAQHKAAIGLPGVFGQNVDSFNLLPVVSNALQWLTDNHLQAEGLWRLEGTRLEADRLQIVVDESKSFPVHQIARCEIMTVLLVRFLQQIPGGLVDVETCDELVSHFTPETPVEDLIQMVKSHISDRKYELFVAFVDHWKLVVATKENKMEAESVATCVFAAVFSLARNRAHHKFGRHQVNLLLIKILSKMLRTTEREAALQLMELEEAEVDSVVIDCAPAENQTECSAKELELDEMGLQCRLMHEQLQTATNSNEDIISALHLLLQQNCIGTRVEPVMAVVTGFPLRNIVTQLCQDMGIPAGEPFCCGGIPKMRSRLQQAAAAGTTVFYQTHQKAKQMVTHSRTLYTTYATLTPLTLYTH